MAFKPGIAHILLAYIVRLQFGLEATEGVCKAVVHYYLRREGYACAAALYLPTLIGVVVVQHFGKVLYPVTAEGSIGTP